MRTHLTLPPSASFVYHEGHEVEFWCENGWEGLDGPERCLFVASRTHDEWDRYTWGGEGWQATHCRFLSDLWPPAAEVWRKPEFLALVATNMPQPEGKRWLVKELAQLEPRLILGQNP